MYQLWLYYGEFLALGVWGVMLALVRRILFGRLCRDTALGDAGKGKMLKSMTLKFEKSFEVKVGICDIPVFVQKYLCQEKKLGIRLIRWRRLPERWTGLTLLAGFVEAMVLLYFGYDESLCLNRFLAAATAAAMVKAAILWFESDSLWEQARVNLLDHVSNTLYPRQLHEYEGFEENPAPETAAAHTEEAPVKKGPDGQRKDREKTEGLRLGREEEQIFQEVLSDFLGSST